jgi:hypothetical protein
MHVLWQWCSLCTPSLTYQSLVSNQRLSLPACYSYLHVRSKVNAGMLTAHRALYKAAAEGDLAAFNAQVAEVQRLFLITYIQATLKYAELMDRATAKGDQDTLLADQVRVI